MTTLYLIIGAAYSFILAVVGYIAGKKRNTPHVYIDDAMRAREEAMATELAKRTRVIEEIEKDVERFNLADYLNDRVH